MKAFITGGSGYVGRNLIRYLLTQGDTLSCLSRSATSDKNIKDAAADKQQEVSIVRGDLEDTNALTQMSGCDVVYHVAALVDFEQPWKEFLKINVQGTQNVVDAAKKAKVPKLIHLSTEAVCVRANHGLTNLDENTPTDPPQWAPYSKSKAMAEEIVKRANGPDLKTAILRPRFIWGNDDTSALAGTIKALQGGSFKWLTPLPVTNVCHVDNLTHAMRLAAEKASDGNVYFVTDGEPVNFKDFITSYVATQDYHIPENLGSVPFWLAMSLAGILENVPFAPKFPGLNRQSIVLIGQDVTIDDSKIRRELGYKPVITTDEGLRKTPKFINLD
ncbi:uncharacterized protein VTP21DRAFT_11611 [Calcarisporiella thermophila]|uniref:uncharacterized protein n=1 Tax=Calcarisporiella thermophila TaxID=911321 RepID=UPI003742E08B